MKHMGDEMFLIQEAEQKLQSTMGRFCRSSARSQLTVAG